MDILLSPPMISCTFGIICIMVSFHYGTQYYPPGWEYALERRNNRRAIALMVVGAAALIGSFFL